MIPAAATPTPAITPIGFVPINQAVVAQERAVDPTGRFYDSATNGATSWPVFSAADTQQLIASQKSVYGHDGFGRTAQGNLTYTNNTNQDVGVLYGADPGKQEDGLVVARPGQMITVRSYPDGGFAIAEHPGGFGHYLAIAAPGYPPSSGGGSTSSPVVTTVSANTSNNHTVTAVLTSYKQPFSAPLSYQSEVINNRVLTLQSNIQRARTVPNPNAKRLTADEVKKLSIEILDIANNVHELAKKGSLRGSEALAIASIADKVDDLLKKQLPLIGKGDMAAYLRGLKDVALITASIAVFRTGPAAAPLLAVIGLTSDGLDNFLDVVFKPTKKISYTPTTRLA